MLAKKQVSAETTHSSACENGRGRAEILIMIRFYYQILSDLSIVGISSADSGARKWNPDGGIAGISEVCITLYYFETVSVCIML